MPRFFVYMRQAGVAHYPKLCATPGHRRTAQPDDRRCHEQEHVNGPWPLHNTNENGPADARPVAIAALRSPVSARSRPMTTRRG